MTRVLIRDRRSEESGTQGREGEGHMKMEAETGVVLLQDKGCWKLPEAGRDKEGCPLRLQRKPGPATP
jgi:hypothetical protein